jgi:flagellar hook-associated protein 3 FlgL
MDAMVKLFGYGTLNAPVIMGGVDGFEEEVCKWLDVADAQLANINRIWTDLGARMYRAELTQERLELDKTVFETLKSQNEDANEAYAMMMLSLSETVYSASLAAGARVIQPTLLDFLR